MRILMVGALYSSMMEDVQAGLAPSSVEKISFSTGLVQFKDGSEIHVKVIQKALDLDKVRGQIYDFMIIHESFPKKADLYQIMHAMQAYILR